MMLSADRLSPRETKTCLHVESKMEPKYLQGLRGYLVDYSARIDAAIPDPRSGSLKLLSL